MHSLKFLHSAPRLGILICLSYGPITLPPRQPRVFARLARWKLAT